MAKVSPEEIRSVLESLTDGSIPEDAQEILHSVWEFYLTAPGSAEMQFKSIMSVMYTLGRRQGFLESGEGEESKDR